MRMVRIGFGLGGLLSLPMVLASCSDPIPPPAQGAVSISVNSCTNTTGDLANVPGGEQPVTSMNVIRRAIDGADGNKMTCKVARSGTGFALTASARSNSVSVALTVPLINTGADAPGALRVSTNNIGALYQSPDATPCTFSVTGGVYGVDVGRIWGSVKCDVIENTGVATQGPGNPQCKVDPGYFVFENCDQ